MKKDNSKPQKRIKKSYWLPAVLLLYIGIITGIFGREWINSGKTIYLIIIVVAELIIITLLTIFLRKREQL